MRANFTLYARITPQWLSKLRKKYRCYLNAFWEWLFFFWISENLSSFTWLWTLTPSGWFNHWIYWGPSQAPETPGSKDPTCQDSNFNLCPIHVGNNPTHQMLRLWGAHNPWLDWSSTGEVLPLLLAKRWLQHVCQRHLLSGFLMTSHLRQLHGGK